MQPGDTTVNAMSDDPRRKDRRRQNLRTALVLLSIAAAFFAGVVAKYTFFTD
jgi:hypothetical protein